MNLKTFLLDITCQQEERVNKGERSEIRIDW